MGLYTLIATRQDGTVLTGFGSTSDIFNVDHVNHVTHTCAEFLNSWEEDLAQMQLTHTPLVAGVVSLPASLGDEIERMRYQIALIKQKIAGAATPPFWYTATAEFTSAVQLAPTAARVEAHTAAQGIPHNTFTQVIFGTTIYDHGGVAASSLLRAPVDGVYICGTTLGFTAIPTGTLVEVLLRMTHSATNRDIAGNAVYATTNETIFVTVETVKRLQAGDTLQTLVYQSSGVTQSLFVNSTIQCPALWMALVGRG